MMSAGSSSINQRAWLRSRPTMLKLGNLLFLHGGVSPELLASGLSLDEVNAIARRNLDVPIAHSPAEDSSHALVMGSAGPLWYRGYFTFDGTPASASPSHVELTKAKLGISHILVGHTAVDRVAPLFGGSVIAVQVYPHYDENGLTVLEGAMHVDGKWLRVTAQGERSALLRQSVLPGC